MIGAGPGLVSQNQTVKHEIRRRFAGQTLRALGVMIADDPDEPPSRGDVRNDGDLILADPRPGRAIVQGIAEENDQVGVGRLNLHAQPTQRLARVPRR